MTTALDPSDNGVELPAVICPECAIDSTPAARPILIAPTWMACAREITALSEEAQKRFIVIAGTLSGNPAAMSSMRSRGTPERSQAATIDRPNKSSRRRCESEPPYFPNGV